MAFTLLEYAKGAPDPLTRGVIKMFADEPLLAMIPFESIPGNSLAYDKEIALPGIAFRGINEAYDESVGVTNSMTENLKIMGGDADTDVKLVRWFGEAKRQYALEAKVRAARLYFLKTFIDGDESTNPKEFDGLNRRIGTGVQRIHADGGTGTAGANINVDSFQVLYDAIIGGPDLFIMGKAARRQLQHVYIGGAYWSFSDPNLFGKRFPMFNGVPIQILDKENNGTTILDFDETEGSSSGDTGSIYAVKFGMDQYVSGIQDGPPEVKDLGELDAKPVYRTRVDWGVGLCVFHSQAIARLSGITKISGVY